MKAADSALARVPGRMRCTLKRLTRGAAPVGPAGSSGGWAEVCEEGQKRLDWL